MDDTIKYTCIWPLERTYHQHHFSDFSPFCSPIKGKERQWRIKGLTMVQWINLNRNNISVLAHQYSALWDKTGLILPLLVGLTAGRQAGRQNTGGFWSSLQVKLFELLFCFEYHCNVTIALALHFSQICQVQLILRRVLKCEKFGYHFSCQSPLIGTNVRT